MVFHLMKLCKCFMTKNAIQFIDEEHASDEDRFLILGFDSKARIVLVCHCERCDGNIIRIISARKATKSECNQYSGGINER